MVFLLYLIVVAFFLYFNKYGFKTYLSLKHKQKKLENLKLELIHKKQMLAKELELQNTSSTFFIELIAREKLRMAKDGEYIYFISTESKDKTLK